jgi:hypothetical protein
MVSALFIVTTMRASNLMNVIIFEGLPAATLKINIFWDMITFNVTDGCRQFSGMHCICLYGRRALP